MNAPQTSKLDLRDVTICALDSVNVEATARALHLSMAQCDFGDAMLLTHAPVTGQFRTVEIDALTSTAAYSKFAFKQLPPLIKTPYLLIVQWDGYVTHPSAWNPVFRDYDYIGARWPDAPEGASVGNGGFSLCSQKFLAAMAAPRFSLDPAVNGDFQACTTFRPALERDCGIRFAPGDVADMFSYENIRPSQSTFGFHGMGNMWRHVEDAEMVRLLDLLDPYVFRTRHFARLMAAYWAQARLDPLQALYARMYSRLGSSEAQRLLAVHVRDGELVSECAQCCAEARAS